jgi:hypothetical protein
MTFLPILRGMSVAALQPGVGGGGGPVTVGQFMIRNLYVNQTARQFMTGTGSYVNGA